MLIKPFGEIDVVLTVGEDPPRPHLVINMTTSRVDCHAIGCDECPFANSKGECRDHEVVEALDKHFPELRDEAPEYFI